MEIKVDDLMGPEIAQLLNEHLHSLAAVSPPGSMHALDLDKLRRPEITFWSVWEGRELLGCGALKELSPKHGEIKSMRTAPSHLRRGVAVKVLETIISAARGRGYRRLSLETGAGPYFAAAHSLYRKFGFNQCSAFVGYVDDPNSVFMSLKLD